jgi:hypothetical protein
MKEIVTYTYEAFDGTVFEDEDECREYEIKEKAKTLSLTMLDHKWNVLNNDKETSYECAFALIVNKKEDIEFINELAREQGYSTPWSMAWGRKGECEEKLGVYVYDENHDRWVNFDEKFAEIKDIYNRCLNFRH